MRLSAEETEAALYCVTELVDRRHRAGVPVPGWMVTLSRKLNLASVMSQSGHESGSEGGELESEHKLIGTQAAAQILGLHPRQVRRLAADLDGEQPNGTWIFKQATVIDYAEGRARGRHCRSVQAASA